MPWFFPEKVSFLTYWYIFGRNVWFNKKLRLSFILDPKANSLQQTLHQSQIYFWFLKMEVKFWFFSKMVITSWKITKETLLWIKERQKSNNKKRNWSKWYVFFSLAARHRVVASRDYLLHRWAHGYLQRPSRPDANELINEPGRLEIDSKSLPAESSRVPGGAPSFAAPTLIHCLAPF